MSDRPISASSQSRCVRSVREVDDVDEINLLVALANQPLDDARVIFVDDAVDRRAGAREQQALSAVLDVCAAAAERQTERKRSDVAASAN